MANVERIGSEEWWKETRAKDAVREAKRTAREAKLAAGPPFDWFWAIVVHKVDKPVCALKFAEITSPKGMHTKIKDRSTGGFMPAHFKATADEIIDGYKRYVASNTGPDGLIDDGKFMRRPAWWLNEGGWTWDD